MKDREIGSWSMKKFGGTARNQYQKYLEEYREMLFELADMWIVICGLKARGTTIKFPDYEGFCKQYSVDSKRLRRIINTKMSIIRKAVYNDVNGVKKRMKSAEEVKQIMLKLAEDRGVIPTGVVDRIANFRATRNMPVSVCPCSASEEEKKKRGCISEMCFKEIQEKGVCKCGCYTRQGYSKNG